MGIVVVFLEYYLLEFEDIKFVLMVFRVLGEIVEIVEGIEVVEREFYGVGEFVAKR